MYPNSTMNDQVLPRYTPIRAAIPRADAFEHLMLLGGRVPQDVILPRGMQITMATKYPDPPFTAGPVSPIMPRYTPVSWRLTQGGYFPLGVDPSTEQYGLGAVLITGAATLLAGMALTYMWMNSQRRA